ncbi:hypothetical protein Tco_0661249 [Tanacetum coccineum]
MLRTCYGHGLTKGTVVHILYHGLEGPTQGILDAKGIFLYNTPNEAFQILEDKVLLKLDFSEEFQISPKTVVSAGGSNIDSYHAMLMEKFEDLVTKIDSEFLIIRKELKEMRDGRRDSHALDDYLMDDMSMCEPHEANYVQRYHGGYHDHEPINSYSYLNHNSHPSRYFEFTETSMEEMMREWMASQMKANEHMKNQVVELENQINQGLRNHQVIIQNLERQFEFLLPTESLPRTTNTKLRHEFVYKPPSIQNDDNKGDVKFIEVDETQPVPTMPNPNPIKANSPTVWPFPKDCTVHIPYTDAKTFADVVLLNNVGEKEFKSIVGDGIGVLTKKKIKKNDMGLSKEPAMKWNMERKIDKWEKPQNLSSKQTNRTDPLPPYAHTKQVNVVFTGSGKSNDFLEIQIDQPSSIIINNKIEKDKPIKTSKVGYHMVETKEYPFREYIAKIPYSQALKSEISHLNRIIKES